MGEFLSSGRLDAGSTHELMVAACHQGAQHTCSTYRDRTFHLKFIQIYILDWIVFFFSVFRWTFHSHCGPPWLSYILIFRLRRLGKWGRMSEWFNLFRLIRFINNNRFYLMSFFYIPPPCTPSSTTRSFIERTELKSNGESHCLEEDQRLLSMVIKLNWSW